MKANYREQRMAIGRYGGGWASKARRRKLAKYLCPWCNTVLDDSMRWVRKYRLCCDCRGGVIFRDGELVRGPKRPERKRK